VNANHIRSVRSGRVRGVCRALHAGSRHQVWQIDILDEQERLCCSSRLTTAGVTHVNIQMFCLWSKSAQ
jgi:1,4-dihydroxy-2-naphthoyl-CoA hydrolase